MLTSGPFFQCEALFLHLYLRRWPHFVEVLSSCCIKALSLFFILRLRPHILHCILRLHPHILYWGFVLIFYFEPLSSYFILRLRPHCFILRLCFSVRGFGRHCCRHLLLCLYYFFGLFAVICVWFCLFVFLCRVTRCQYYLVEFLFTFFTFYVYFLVFNRAIRYFGLHAATLILISGFVISPVLICVDIIVLCLLWCDTVMCFFMLHSPGHIITLSFVVLENLLLIPFCLGDPDWIGQFHRYGHYTQRAFFNFDLLSCSQHAVP